MFQSETWKAISQGLRLLQASANDKALDTSLSIGKRDESVGVYNMSTDMLELPAHVAAFHNEIREPENPK